MQVLLPIDSKGFNRAAASVGVYHGMRFEHSVAAGAMANENSLFDENIFPVTAYRNLA
jgi:hypothetical protein